ncbi:uncharacterized protein N7482_006545 [Penicillium canariense]|uniref:Uncharacterized protein n=1 Tax=Penicillium canariense TaxID=189055 RepID=A0A9W9LJR3_9EURO|nr:uncharacterized protein N7482_006545 [Penicillium canariense]KAJ5159541.1 hypothetical protein N7482_006545 [Penicillium canariense]
MPYPRPVSSLRLETHTAPIDDITGDELLGSDDELNETGRAAQQQRIEKLAESYLQGRPLLILSAALRGPFEKDWKNPWKKDRRVIVNGAAKKHGKKAMENAGHVIQETDLGKPKYREDLAVASRCRSEARTITIPPPTALAPNASPSVTPRSAQKRTLQTTAYDEQNRAPPRSIKRTKETYSSRIDDYSFATGGPADWLKKDRRRMDFTRFEPPSSPTPKNACRQAENKTGVGFSRAMEVRVPVTPSPIRNSGATAIDDKVTMAEAMDISPENTPLEVPMQQIQDPANSEKSPIPRQSPIAKGSLKVKANGPAQSSFRVISSSSQLPRFEYRRPHRKYKNPESEEILPVESLGPAENESHAERPAAAESAAKEAQQVVSVERSAANRDASDVNGHGDIVLPDIEGNLRAAIGPIGIQVDSELTLQEDDIAIPDVPEESSEPLAKNDREGADEPVRTPRDLTFIDEANGSSSTEGVWLQTEQNTHESFPSAQQIAVPPGVSDRIPSLHSTAMPRKNPEQKTEHGADTQLSTQAALLHAQRSFQEDLESPEPEYPHLADPEDTVWGPGEESLLAHETPYNGPQYFERVPDLSLRGFSKGKVQAMSTQYMIDAASPYTFSTEKQIKPFREISLDPRSSKKNGAAPNAELSSPSPRVPSPSQEKEFHTAHASPSRPEAHPEPEYTHRSATQRTLLPFALSGSTPTTAQDGQGAHQGPESFDLSQAIADAGSWLQQSFDFMKEIGRPSQATRPA